LSRWPWPSFCSGDAESQGQQDVTNVREAGKVKLSTSGPPSTLAIFSSRSTLTQPGLLHLTTLREREREKERERLIAYIHVHHKHRLRHLPKQVFGSLI